MSRFKINRFVDVPVEKLRELLPGDKIVLLTYKRDRKIIISKVDNRFCNVTVDGFKSMTLEGLDEQQLIKQLRKLEPIEFPRSKMFYLEIIEDPDAQKDSNAGTDDNNAIKFNVTIENNSYVEKFFKDNPQYKSDIENNAYNVLPEIISFRPYKIKPAHDLKRNGHTIFEYRISLKNIDFRAAYTQIATDINIFFISKVIVKRLFVKQLEATSLVD